MLRSSYSLPELQRLLSPPGTAYPKLRSSPRPRLPPGRVSRPSSYTEAAELTVGEHLHPLSAQYLARALQPHHPNHEYVLLDRGPRPMKHTLRYKVFDLVEPHLQLLVSGGTFDRISDALHKEVVIQYVDASAPNRVINRSSASGCP